MRIPVDQAARDRIARDLDPNMLVEAGAGSGKTKSLVDRMLAHVERGTAVERLAAVTFTRKAAAELRERFESELEKRLRGSDEGSERRARLSLAREHLDRAFVGTIHSFAARLLREHPLEAGIDPAFEEIGEEEWPGIRQGFWNRWLERERRSGGEALEQLRERGIDPRALLEGFQEVVRFPDVEFPAPAVAAPNCAPCRQKLGKLLARTQANMPDEEPDGGWDRLQRVIRRLRRLERITDWGETRQFCDALATISSSNIAVVQKRWIDKPTAKALCAEWVDLFEHDIAEVLRTWREHRYHFVMRALKAAAGEFARERRATGRLGFEDLLLGSVALLRDNPAIRHSLGERYRYLLVDEFQDTDPIQAELCFLLASPPDEGDDWRSVTPRSGALFVVGDPKQSIYRFRRADIQTYELVKQRIAACGTVLELVENFRSVRPVEDLVDGYFRTAFPAAATQRQAAFAPLRTRNEPVGQDGVYVYPVVPAANNKDEILSACSESVASWIEARVRAGTCTPGDVLILAYNKASLHSYARALALRNIPASVAGGAVVRDLEFRELVVVLQALADPANPVAVAAALEGLYFGCSPADLYESRSAGVEFSIALRPGRSETVAERGLVQLHEWWIAAQRLRPDLLVERILDDAGILAYAAGQPLGDSRAGALLHLVEALRGDRAGGLTLSGAIDTIEALREADGGESSLLPGRSDAVRVMNLHKAKGLEAPIVILAAPIREGEHPINAHVVREATGRATGGLRICCNKSEFESEIVAQPVGWNEMEATEAEFLHAEKERLRYVAATRAKRELVIASLQFHGSKGPAPDLSFWSPLTAAAARTGGVVEMRRTQAAGRRSADLTADQLAARIAAADGRRSAASRAAFGVVTVTESAKLERELVR
ncbi:MAG TPA: UvrD-helicase domain-containing protein, partial [Gemmatimonadales bacterium]|nr:UvrD-helicase domain-containing protein [Gemmatimonadales bacterium]